MSTLPRAKPVILCFVAYYLPGYRSGGPARTIVNFVEQLGDEFDVRIVTSDRDALDHKPYSGVSIDAWNTVGKAKVFYTSARMVNLRGIAEIMNKTAHDICYLNGYFSYSFTALPLLARRLGLAPQKPCVIAPRGQFSKAAIAFKAWKKRPYMQATRLVGLYKDLIWQASSVSEANDVRRELGSLASVVAVAPDLPLAIESVELKKTKSYGTRPNGPLRIVFLSRISPMKNLDFLLETLRRVETPLEFTIYGPLRDSGFWNECQALISQLPHNISVDYCGEVAPTYVSKAFAGADLFVLPTLGENYGHVILESLAAGTAVLISDRTPWLASEDKAVEVLSLEDPAAWVKAIERWAGFDCAAFAHMRNVALIYAQQYLKTNQSLERNRALFRGVLKNSGNTW